MYFFLFSDFTDLSESFFKIKCKIWQKDASNAKINGAAQSATDSYGFVNLPAASLFSSVGVRLGETILNNNYNCYSYLAFFQVLLNYSKER